MAINDPTNTTWGDICTAALQDCGRLGLGMNPLAEDLSIAGSRGQWMLQQWERKRWLIYHLVTQVVTSTGQTTPDSVGPTGGGLAPQVSSGTFGFSARPNRIESAFLRQSAVAFPNGPIDYPLTLLESFEDYNQIRIKGLQNWAFAIFYDPAWPLGQLYLWPWPQANLYAIGITVREQLPAAFSLAGNPLTAKMNLPFEYYEAIVSNLAVVLRARYGLATWPGDPLPMRAKNSLATIRGGNTAISTLSMPVGIPRRRNYNIFNDEIQ